MRFRYLLTCEGLAPGSADLESTQATSTKGGYRPAACAVATSRCNDSTRARRGTATWPHSGYYVSFALPGHSPYSPASPSPPSLPHFLYVSVCPDTPLSAPSRSRFPGRGLPLLPGIWGNSTQGPRLHLLSPRRRRRSVVPGWLARYEGLRFASGLS